jgi:NhaP-type Na+/H+ or K+/H+ antiporter
LGGLLGASVLLVVVVLNVVLAKVKAIFPIIHESGASIAFGCLAGALALATGHPRFLSLDARMFSRLVYLALLPAIVFHAGLTLEKRHFFDNLGSILAFAVAGTIANALVLSAGFWLFSIWGLWAASLEECLMFGAVLSATDTVATIAALREIHVDPRLHSLVFGESLLNDAVSIALVSVLSRMPRANSRSWITIVGAVSGNFAIQGFGSLIIGVVIALAGAFTLRNLVLLHQQPGPHHPGRLPPVRHLSSAHELSIVLLGNYVAYSCAQALALSGILSLLSSSLLVGHYAWLSLRRSSRVALYECASWAAYLSETACFVAIGFELISSLPRGQDWHWPLIGCSIGLLLLARAVAVFPLSALLNLCHASPISLRYSAVMWNANIRGAISVILALNLPFDIPNRLVIINATFAAVLFTNAVLAPLTRPFAMLLGIHQDATAAATEESDPLGADIFRRASRIEDPGLIGPTEFEPLVNRAPSWLQTRWNEFDERVMKRYFGPPRSF